MERILEVKDLKVQFYGRNYTVQAVRGVDFSVGKKEILGIVGESGSGKSVTMKAVMGLLPDNARRSAQEITFLGSDLSDASDEEYRRRRGRDMTMIFQDPMTALNPLMKIGDQLTEVIMRHGNCKKAEAVKRALEMMEKVGIPEPMRRMKQYPHEFSGGMRQRVLIAMALSCRPQLLIADEPTTALDVTIQAQILELLAQLKDEFDTSVILITHDMGVVATVCTHVAIMYGGMIMERGTVEEIFYEPKHPYTQALLQAIPSLNLAEGERLVSIEGMPPSLSNPPAGCPFAPRCTKALEGRCAEHMPKEVTFSASHSASCFLYTNQVSDDEVGDHENSSDKSGGKK